VEGLSQFNENEANNMLQGHEQSMEMTHLLQKDPGHQGVSAANTGQ